MTSTVTVASKLPNGLILRVFKMKEMVVNGKVESTAEQVGDTFTIRGNAVPFGAVLADGAGGFALTHGIPADFWEEWLKQNRDLDAVKNGLVFAHAKPGHATGEAQEKEALRSGLEPLAAGAPGAASNDPRAPRRLNPSLAGVGTADVRNL